MKVIGGFFELLLPKNSFQYHKNACALSNGRACVRVILQNITIKKCYLPNYTCDAVYEPFILEKVPFELYNIDNNLDPLNLPELKEDEFFYYINYYGIKNSKVKKLQKKYGSKLIIDNTHDFFKKKQFTCWSFTSARKYFGLPDGAFLYSPVEVTNSYAPFVDYSLQHNIERLKGNQEEAFIRYQAYETSLTSEIFSISNLSNKMLSLVDIKKARRVRIENFIFLHSKIGHLNTLAIDKLAKNDTPFCYPFLPRNQIDKTLLYKHNIFIPALWTDPINREETTIFENKIAQDLLSLPIDERYNFEDLTAMIEKIIK